MYILQGLPGASGANGSDGIPGERGSKGVPGMKGDTGDTGEEGRKGSPVSTQDLCTRMYVRTYICRLTCILSLVLLWVWSCYPL